RRGRSARPRDARHPADRPAAAPPPRPRARVRVRPDTPTLSARPLAGWRRLLHDGRTTCTPAAGATPSGAHRAAARAAPGPRRRPALRGQLDAAEHPAPARSEPGRGRGRGRAGRLRRPARRRRVRAAPRRREAPRGPHRLEAAHRGRARGVLLGDPPPRGGPVDRGHPAGGGRPPRGARRQRRGDAPRRRGALPPTRLRVDRRVRRTRVRHAGARGAQGGPGRRVRRGRVGAGEGHQGPDHGRAGRRVPPVRVRRAQGLLHAGPRRGPLRPRAQPRAPVLVRQRARGARRRATALPPARRGRGGRRIDGRHDRGGARGGPRRRAGPQWGAGRRDVRGFRRRGSTVSAEDLEKYETEMELTLYKEYRDIVSQFSYVVETERRFYLANSVDVTPRNADGEIYFEVRMSDAWVWDMYRPARFVKNVRVLTFKDVNVEELEKPDLRLPEGDQFGP